MAPRLNPLLRLLYTAIDVGRWLAPPSRRREWRRQWRADVAHEWQWLERRNPGLAARAGLMARVAGALRHAFWLRLHDRRLEMMTQDLRYGWRQMVHTPFFKTLLVGVSATDAASFAGTAALLVAVAMAATYLPARRASRIDAMRALRAD